MPPATVSTKAVRDSAARNETNDRVFRWLHQQTPESWNVELKKSVAALPLMKDKLHHRGLRTASAQLAHASSRMFSVLEGKGILRTCTEDFMLASQYKPHDPSAAEFIRTFRHQHFFGKYYLNRYDALYEQKETVDIRIQMPRHGLGENVPD